MSGDGRNLDANQLSTSQLSYVAIGPSRGTRALECGAAAQWREVRSRSGRVAAMRCAVLQACRRW